MKICFNETIDTSSLENDLELCEKYGYDYIEIRLSYLKDYLKTHSMDDLKAYFDTHNIKPYGYNSITEVNFCTDEGWKTVSDEFLFACEAAKKLGGRSIVTVPTCRPEMADKTEQEVFDDSVKMLLKLSDMAQPYDVMINWEPIGGKGVFAVQSIAQAWKIVEATKRDNIGITVDAFNMFAYNGFADMDDLKQIPVEKMGVFHINDAMDMPLEELDTLKNRLYPGEGAVPLEKMCRLLKDMGYDAVASVELFGDWMYEGTPEDVIRDGYRKTKEFIDKIWVE